MKAAVAGGSPARSARSRAGDAGPWLAAPGDRDGYLVPLGALIRDRRIAAGLTQRELATAAGVSVGVIRDLEQGLTGRPRAVSVLRLETVLGIGFEPGAWDAGKAAAAPAPGDRHPDPGQAASTPEQATGLRIQVLGSLRAWRRGSPVSLGPGRQRALLGLLATRPGMALSRDAITDALWGEDPPPTATPMIQSYVSRLRRVLDPGHDPLREGGHLTRSGTAYQLRAGDDEVDVTVFRRLLEQARAALAAGDTSQACVHFEDALALWHGEVLADIDILRAHPAVTTLAGQRDALIIDYAEAASLHGWHDRVLPHLRDLTQREPLNERACARLMLALAGGGQQAAALRVFHHVRRQLDAELGVRPGAELVATHERVLHHSVPPSSPGGPGVSLVSASGPVSVCHLPPALADFTGRHEQVGQLTLMLSPEEGSVGVPVAALTGLPGTGKTALALHAAHTLRPYFPGGQLWVPLDGSSVRPRDAGEVLGELLRTLGVPGSAIPESLTGRAALYRARLAGSAVLVVIDDAVSAAQVEPLLPGTAGSAVIVTSRTPLSAPSGSRLIHLSPLSPGEAVDLLGRVAGVARVAAEPQAAAELADACGLLPLAVRIAGARLAARPSWPISVLAGKVCDQRRRLDELEAGDLSVRASVALSYEALDHRAQLAFRLLGLLGPADVSEWLVAALLNEMDAADTVNELTNKSLLTPAGTDATGQPRYRLHDLLRDYAAERAAEDPSQDRDAALARALAGWLQLAGLAADRMPGEPYFPAPRTRAHTGPVREVLAAQLTADPIAWFGAERLNLIAAVDRACAAGDHQAAADLVCAQAGLHYLHSRHEEAGQLWRVIAEAAEAACDLPGAAAAQLRMAATACEYGRHAAATQAVERCVAAFGASGDRSGLATALYWRSVCATNLGHFDKARAAAEGALDLARENQDRHAEAMAMRMVGLAETRLPGCQAEGTAWCERALAIARESGPSTSEREVLHTLAHAYTLVGRHEEAVRLCEQGMALDRQLGYPGEASEWRAVMGDAYYRIGRYADAVDAFSQALPAFRDRFHHRHYALCLLKLGHAYQSMGRPAQAIGHLEQGREVFRELRLPHYVAQAEEAIHRCLQDSSP